MRDAGLAVRSGLRMRANSARVITRLFIPGQEMVGGSESRASNAITRVLALSEAEVEDSLGDLFSRFETRHSDLAQVFEAHAERVAHYVPTPISVNRRQLLGATFTHEYSLEGASICNPSLVAHPDQGNLEAGALRAVLSYRSIGEGHHSAICFRTGVIDSRGELTIDAPHAFPEIASISRGLLENEIFHAKLREADLDGATAASVLDGLGETFSYEELEVAIDQLLQQSDLRPNADETGRALRSIAECIYDANFAASLDLSRRVLWPATAAESHGVEDARFVRFDDDGVIRYLASYTAFDGNNVSQQLLETSDFQSFHSLPMAGIGAQNKGMAFFPRRVDGRFMALSRYDRESNSLAVSDSPTSWDDVVSLQVPVYPWELLQLGNCGSPIELPEGWLVLTHGVGPMRTYGIGAILLDLDDPSKVIAQLDKPLLLPEAGEQDGYVPNVVYSCGSLVHNGNLYLPYGISDQAMSYVTIDIQALIEEFGLAESELAS